MRNDFEIKIENGAQKINENTDNIVLASIYRLQATNFIMSARILFNYYKEKDGTLIANLRALPFYYLVSHACELLLKCALLKRAIPIHRLKNKNIWHSLLCLLAELEKKEVYVGTASKEVIKKLDGQHKTHAIRYDGILRRDNEPNRLCTPDPSLIFKMLDEILLLGRIGNI